MLFCFFAEDTGIFPSDKFTNSIASHTAQDGSDLQDYLEKLFEVLSTEERDQYPNYLKEFPYVNGGLFSDYQPAPKFSTKSRKIVIECGALNWKAINPDIFGSMMQAIVHTEQRSGMGMHYTSVVNIMKVIEPLFLNDLYDELEKAGTSEKKLQNLLKRIYNIKIFDPACGSGNFLIIAYKKLCKLEIEIFKKLYQKQRSFRFQNGIKLTQFYGIEIDDFAHEIAKLSFWLAEHQMNLAFKQVFGESRPTLPLREGGNIVCGNALNLDWEKVCANSEENETFTLGNPPYVGFKMQSSNQKSDITKVFSGLRGYKKLDYIACWIMKATRHIVGHQAKFAFVSTNSICQGEHVSLLWPHIYSQGVEIDFAYPSFKWKNNARSNAGVMCCIVGVRNPSNRNKYIYKDHSRIKVKTISSYLTANDIGYVVKQSKPISSLPKMTLGNMPKDDGHLILSESEKDELITKNPNAKRFIKKLIGAHEFIRRTYRWCIWIRDNDLAEACEIEEFARRIEKVQKFRAASSDKSARAMADTPYKFREQHEANNTTLIIPTVTSQRRLYIPMGFLDKDTVVVAPNNAIYDPDTYLFAILSSRMHMTWVRTVAGRLKTDYRYSSVLCYNTFPFPNITSEIKSLLEAKVLDLLDEREKFPEKTIAELYDPNTMPKSLFDSHRRLDEEVDRCYRSQGFDSDDERLGFLFALYQSMLDEQTKNGARNA